MKIAIRIVDDLGNILVQLDKCEFDTYGKKDLFPEDRRGSICYCWQNSGMEVLSTGEEIW